MLRTTYKCIKMYVQSCMHFFGANLQSYYLRNFSCMVQVAKYITVSINVHKYLLKASPTF